VKHLVNEIQRD